MMSYYFWAEDAVIGGRTRRTMSDMFFAEVRHFEEIFRQGQQPPQGSQQQQQQQGPGMQNQGGQAQQLADQQKEIINATWNLLRKEDDSLLSNTFQDDATVIRDAQTALMTQVEQLAQRLNDGKAQALTSVVTQHMQQAADELGRAAKEQILEPLESALAPEQAAYQALLRLRAREHEVIRSNQQNSRQSRGGGAGASRSQRQLQQLSLSNDQNRYETQRQARQQQEGAQSQERQVLNRLRELARRQSDLNERLKELQAELEQAETEEEREELLKQLKRLREEQQEILRDTDELNSQMNDAQNPQNESEARQRLEQARENVRRTSEALERGQVSQALTSGTRAQRELDELREEYRKRTSSRFADEARELKRQADDLAEAERELSKLLEPEQGEEGNQRRSLRDASPRERLVDELAQQEERLEDLLEQMQQTVRDAEEPQPLLAQELYDSYRRASQNRLQDKLAETRQSVQRGFLDDAQQRERAAREGIEQLRDEIERAAESVLGDETEALRRARSEIEELAEQLNQEIDRADPQSSDRQSETPQSKNGRKGRPSQETKTRAGGGQDGKQEQQGGKNQNRQSETTEPKNGRKGRPSPETKKGAGGGQDGKQEQQGGKNRKGSGRRETKGPDDGLRAGGPSAGGRREEGPLTGRDFRQWSDRLRDVEEMVGDPELRSDVARVRDRAREVRSDLIRHSQEPNWELVRLSIAQPLMELRDRIGEELQRRTSKKALVPIDRDPVPTPYVEQVRRYYERIGSGK
jgi:hypothetical protein